MKLFEVKQLDEMNHFDNLRKWQQAVKDKGWTVGDEFKHSDGKTYYYAFDGDKRVGAFQAGLGGNLMEMHPMTSMMMKAYGIDKSKIEKKKKEEKKKDKKINEGEKQNARWVKAQGPNKTPGFEFQHDQGTGWETVGFAKAKPESTVGSVEVYNGATNKSVTVNLRNYTFGDEDAVA